MRNFGHSLLAALPRLAAALCLAAAWPGGADARQEGELLAHGGMCEASAAVALPEAAFGSLFVAANDEDNTLRVYAADRSGGPLADRDLGEFLGLNVSRDDDEADIEAAAWLGGRIFWIGSHMAHLPARRSRHLTSLHAG